MIETSELLENLTGKEEHYQQYSVETIETIKNSSTKEEFEGYCKGNVIKYISRYRFKGGIKDLDKAIKYIEYLKET